MTSLDEALEREDEKAPDLDARMLRRLLAYLKPYRGRVVIAVLLLLTVSALGIAGPYLVKLAIDGALQGDAPAAERLGQLLQICGLFVGILIAESAVHYGQIMVLQVTGQRVMFDLRNELFRHVLRQDQTVFDRQPVGRLMTRLTSDIEALNELFTSGVVTVAMDVFTLVAIMGVMIAMDWRLALVSFAVIPPLFLLSAVFRRRVRRSFRRIRVRVARINSFLQEHLSGHLLVSAFGQQERRLRRFEELNRDHTQAHLETVNAFAVFFPAVEILSTAAVVLLLWVGGDLLTKGMVSLGTLVAFVQYAQRFYRPISDLSEKFNILQGAMAASERIFALLDRQPTITAPERPAKLDRVAGAVVFENVRFGYVGGEPVLKGLSFTVRPGERVAIVGSTGAGKTTVISLLSRLYDVDSGRITVDGVDVREYDPRQLRRQVGVVLQDPRLFSGSLRENLRLWDTTLSAEGITAAVDRIGLGDVISRFPQGLDQEMGEGGGRISTGERQLVAFARALAHDPPILVLDEATASVDTVTEARIQAAIDELLKERTSLVIAHRLSTVRRADRILVLHHGQLVEQGNHEELMAHDGVYRRLVDIELGAQADRATVVPTPESQS